MNDLFQEFPPVSTADWEAEIARDLPGRSAETLASITEDGVEIRPFYRAEHLAGIEPRTLYSHAGWTIACEVSDPESARYAVSRGAAALYVESANTDIGALEDVDVIRADSPDLVRGAGVTPLEQLRSVLRRRDAALVELPVDTDYFVEIAKFRAMRLAWQQMSDKPVRILARTKRHEGNADPYTNLVRGTTEAMSAIIGGADVIVVRPFDAAYQNPGEFSRRLSINTQLILRDESHLGGMPDPAAGCWYVEWLTAQFVARVQAGARE